MAILISIKPEWLEKILNGEKTIEIRKTKPKCELPCKVYIYCTKPKKWYKFSNWGATSDELLWKTPNEIKMCNGFKYWAESIEYCRLNGRVVAEFMLNEVTDLRKMHHLKATGLILYKGAMDMAQYHEYGGRYAWHISNLKIYDKPKELGQFRKMCDGFINCLTCKRPVRDDIGSCDGIIRRPPQSWCYCEEI